MNSELRRDPDFIKMSSNALLETNMETHIVPFLKDCGLYGGLFWVSMLVSGEFHREETLMCLFLKYTSTLGI